MFNRITIALLLTPFLMARAAAVEAIGIAPADAAAAKALGFPRPSVFYGANDSRAPAGSAAAP
jgi:hypothetical protein